MPDTFIDYKNSAFCWAYGAIQIGPKGHAAACSRQGSQFASGQRYHFCRRWLGWDFGLNIFFTAGALFFEWR